MIIDVTAAIIECDGKILLAQRKSNGHLPGKWEFPGGKLEQGELPERCLARELEEELGIHAVVGDLFHTNTHHYSEKSVRLLTYKIESYEGTITPHDHEQLHWVSIEKIIDYDLAEADIPIAHKLMEASNV